MKVPRRLPSLRRRRRGVGDDEVVYLIAPSGHPNYGDELIARAWLQHLARTRPDATVILDSHTAGQAGLLLHGIHPHAVFVDTLWQLTHYASDTTRADGPDPAEPWTWVARAATELGLAPRLAEGVDAFLNASSVHLLGGGYVNQVWPHHVSLVVAAAELVRTTGVTAFASGQGLIPRVDGPAWSALRDAAAAFTVFDVRDEASSFALSGVGSRRHTGDDAWLALDRPAGPGGLPDPSPTTRDGVTLCLQSDLTDDFTAHGMTGPDALARVVEDILDAWQVPGSAVTVVEGIPGGDLDIPSRLGDRLEGATIVPFIDIWRSGLPVGRGDTWISTRFHPHLVAAAAGDSGVAIIPRPDYYATKHRSLAAAGSRWTIIDDPDVVPARPTAGGFSADDRDRAVAAKRVLAHRLYPRRRR